MARRVHDVEPDAPVGDAGLLGQDGDASLALEVHRVHDPIDHDLVDPKGTGLSQHGVDQGGLAMVDVGDDGDIADVRADGFGRHGDGGRCGHGALDCRTSPALDRMLAG